MSGLVSVLKFLWNHPLNRADRTGAIIRFARWQIAARVAPDAMTFPFVENTVLLASRGTTGATGNYYCGLHEHSEMAFVLHALRPDDLFVDVGANVGSYTVLAAGAVGSSVIAVEPIPATFEKLRRNVAINALSDRVVLVQKGLAARDGELRFTATQDTVNHVALADDRAPAVSCAVTTLDAVCRGRSPTVVKIDVEGFEHDVVAGSATTLSSPDMAAVIMETNGSGVRYGKSDEALIAEMGRYGFDPYGYDPVTRQLRSGTSRTGNTIFVRDRDAIAGRLSSARQYRLINGLV